MNKETLKTLRVILPGIIILLGGIPFFQNSLKGIFETLKYWDGVVYLIIVIFLGGIYHVSNLRYIFLKDSAQQIRDNIKDGLTKPFLNDDLISKNIAYLFNGEKLIHVFYDLVDHNESLKEKAKNVYMNGLFWSTFADISSISLINIFVYVFAFLISSSDYYLFLLVLSLIVYFVCSKWIMPIVTKKHIALSNDQIDFINTQLKNELHLMLNNIVKQKDS